jgi:hypothetical protein
MELCVRDSPVYEEGDGVSVAGGNKFMANILFILIIYFIKIKTKKLYCFCFYFRFYLQIIYKITGKYPLTNYFMKY